MKVCKDCGHEVSNSAKVCPNCGRRMKKPIVRYIFLGIIILAIIGGVIACNAEKPRKKEFKQDEVATYNDVEYSITKVERSNGVEFFEPEEGKEYIIINLKIENKSDEKIPYNSLDWKLKDGSGDEQEFTLFGFSVADELDSGDLNPKGTKTGSIVFEIPKGDKDLTLRYYDTILDDERAFEFKITD